MKGAIISTIICALAFCVSPAQAYLITIEIEAEIDFVGDPYNLLGGNIQVGDTITGSYTYESTTPDSNPLPNGGDYWHYQSPCGVFLSVSGFEFRTDLENVEFLVEIINNYPPDDDYLLRSYNNLPLSNGTSVDHISWWLYDPTGNALSSYVLPTTPPVLDDWQENRLLIHGPLRGISFGIEAHVTSAIPEPATLLLFALGGLFLRN